MIYMSDDGDVPNIRSFSLHNLLSFLVHYFAKQGAILSEASFIEQGTN